MSLRDFNYQEDYRSGSDDLLSDFFQPCLSRAQVYWRAAGYFCSSALEALGTPLDEFVTRGGTMRLLTSVELTQRDVEAIQAGQDQREVSEERILQIIDEQFSHGVGDGVSRLLALLRTGRLELRLAIPSNGFGGIYHEKVGLFFDNQPEEGGDFVAFSGSSNESRSAFERNYECVDVFPSWDDLARAQRKRHHFETLWNNQDKGAQVFLFSEAAKRNLIRLAEHGGNSQFLPTIEEEQNGESPDSKWRHQDDARAAFLKHERGVLEMATGTGKTKTALSLVKILFESNKIDTVIISTNGTDLLSQWHAQVIAQRKDWSSHIGVYRHFAGFKDAEDFRLNPKKAVLLCSHSPLASVLKRLKPEIASRTLIIYDEVHGLGSPGNRRELTGLSDPIRFRLGLSATPEREYDEDGNDFIETHVGPTLYEFGLKEAIERGILAPFNYHPLPYFLSLEDKQKLRDVHAQSAARAASGNSMSPEEVWMALARVYKLSREKLSPFKKFLQSHPDVLRRCIIFVETKEYGEEVTNIIHSYRNDFHTYFAENDSEVLARFGRGELECLVTCHRLSEGIDIRSLQTVILFSSSKARLETIQRIGRCLRTNPDEPGKIATVVDFVRQSEKDDGDLNADQEREIWLSDLATVRPLPRSN